MGIASGELALHQSPISSQYYIPHIRAFQGVKNLAPNTHLYIKPLEHPRAPLSSVFNPNFSYSAVDKSIVMCWPSTRAHHHLPKGSGRRVGKEESSISGCSCDISQLRCSQDRIKPWPPSPCREASLGKGKDSSFSLVLVLPA